MVDNNPAFDDGSRRQLALRVDRAADKLKRSLGLYSMANAEHLPESTRDPSSSTTPETPSKTFSSMAARLVDNVVARTSERVGAGRMTAIVLAQSIFGEAVKAVTSGADPFELCRGLEAALDVVLGELQRQSRPMQGLVELTQMATVQARGDARLGALIAEAMDRVGVDGAIALLPSHTSGGLQWADGLQLDGGLLKASFAAADGQVVGELVDALVLLCDWPLTSSDMLRPAVEHSTRRNKPLLVVAPRVSPEVVAFVGELPPEQRVCIVEAPESGAERLELLDDIAVLCCGRVFSEHRRASLVDLVVHDLGRAKTVIVERDRTTFIGGAAADGTIQTRVRQIRAQLEDCLGAERRRSLGLRLGRLVGGVAMIPVGNDDDAGLEERMDSVEHAVMSVRAAFRGGTVPGGGVALVRCLPAVVALHVPPDQEVGVHVMSRALCEPLRQIARNAGANNGIIDSVRNASGAYGYNTATGRCEDLVAAGVVDPTMVVRAAVQSATTVAASFLIGGSG